MTGINRKNGSLRVSLSFATKCHFRSNFTVSFAAAKLMLLCCGVALVCQNHFRNCEILCGIGLLVRNHAFSFRNAFRSCEIDATVLRSGTRVPNPLSQLRNTLAEASTVLRNGLAAKCQFHRSFLHPAKFRRALFFPCFCPVFEISSTWDHLKRLKHT